MNTKCRKCITLLAAVIVILLVYFYFAPIYLQGLSIFSPRPLNLSSARDYYSVLSSFITLLALFLGYLYYIHKLQVDKEVAERDRKRKRLDILIEEINNYDNWVDELIHFRFNDDAELEKIRNKISRSNEKIVAMLMHKTKLLGLDDKNGRRIIRVHSFVEQNDILMQYDYRDLTKEKLLSVKNKYIELIQDARQTCFEKIC